MMSATDDQLHSKNSLGTQRCGMEVAIIRDMIAGIGTNAAVIYR